MNKAITAEELKRMQRCISEMGNKINCYEDTGIHYSTIDKILERKWAKQEAIDKLLDYCDKVEGVGKYKTA